MCISAPDLILLYFDEFFTPPTTNTLFVLDGHWGRKLLKCCSNTSVAIRVSALRMLCASTAPQALGQGEGEAAGKGRGGSGRVDGAGARRAWCAPPAPTQPRLLVV